MARITIEDKIKSLNIFSKVKIKVKKLKDKKRLYLDYYKNNKHYYTFLDIYLTGDNAKDDLMLKLAVDIREQKVVEINALANNIIPDNYLKNFMDFKTFYLKCLEGKKIKNANLYKTALNSFMNFLKKDYNLHEIDSGLIKSYLNSIKHLSTHTQCDYLIALKYVFNKAVIQNFIVTNPVQVSVKKEESDRVYLSIEEIVKIHNTTGDFNDIVKYAFIFSCFTGLRISDIYNLTWNDIDNGYMNIRQQKTKSFVKMKLSSSALKILENVNRDSENVFSLPTYKYIRSNLEKLIKLSGISKKITFHCARHTFATLCLTYEVDIYTVSKLLGHSNVSTTQIYAKLIDKKKDEAIDKLPDLE